MIKNPARKNTFTVGFSLFELLLSIAILALIALPFITTYRTSRTTQALKTSSEQFADHVRNAHVFAREAADKKGWGGNSKDETTYQLVAGAESAWEVASEHRLQTEIVFTDNFFVWFDIGVGETDSNYDVILEASNGQQMNVSILKTGVVEVEPL